MLGITTPADKSNWYMRMVEEKTDDGELKFTHIKYENACEDCVKKGDLAIVNCRHNPMGLDPWRNSKDQQQFQGTVDTKSLLAEFRGIATENSCYFIFDSIDAFMKSSYDPGAREPVFYYALYDPNGGGSSKAAITICSNMNSKIVVRIYVCCCSCCCSCCCCCSACSSMLANSVSITMSSLFIVVVMVSTPAIGSRCKFSR